jgi:hypothetical protein
MDETLIGVRSIQAMSAPTQIKKNAQWVIDNFGPESGVPQFGYNAQSVAYLDTFLDRQGESLRASDQSTDRIVSLLGSFLGEAIIASYGGNWQQSEAGIAIVLESGAQVHFVNPFHKILKRLTNGQEENLHAYFARFLPQVLSQPEAGDPPPNSPPGGGPKKPWWKIF